MDSKKLPIVITLVVVAVVVLLWSMKGSLGIGGNEKAPTGPPKQAMEEYTKHTGEGGKK